MTRAKKNPLTKEQKKALQELSFLFKPKPTKPDDFSIELAKAIKEAKSERNGALTTKYGTMSF